MPGLVPADEFLSCCDKKGTKETSPAAPAFGFPRSRPPARPASQTRYAQTASPEYPGLAVFRSAGQRGIVTHGNFGQPKIFSISAAHERWFAH